MIVEYLDLVDYVAIAAEVTGLDVQTIVALPNLGLAESALHAPASGFERAILAIASGEWDHE